MEELEKDTGLLRRLKKGKMTEDEFDAKIGIDVDMSAEGDWGSKSNCREESTNAS